MRLTVTPIGASGTSAASIAMAVVNYLEGETTGSPGVGVLGLPGASASADYYSDSIEGPGRWIGAGSAFRGLRGVVDREAFQRVLEGRHPATGERLVSSQGSAQRRHLGVGTYARLDRRGQPLYEPRDVARLLGMRSKEVAELLDAGRGPGPHEAADPTWIGSVDDSAGGRLVPDAEITRHLEIHARPPKAADVRATGEPDDLLSVGEAARLLKVTPTYLRRLCANGERAADARTATWLPSTRTTDNGHFRIRRDDLAEFADRRRAPIARVGFDLTLTAEKSIGLLTMLSTGNRQEHLVAALRTANDSAIDYLDRSASVARRRGRVVNSEGLIVASYVHGTSRALDPHPHHHNVIANAVVDDEGGVRTLDARALYRQAPAAAALATAALRWELRDLGLGWWRRSDGVWEVAGVDASVIREFSNRRIEMDEVRKALEERLGRRVTHDEENTIAKSTRSAKRAVDPIGLRKEWLTRADRVGLDIESCFDRVDRALAHEVLPDDMRAQLFDAMVDPIVGLCAQSNTFGRAEVMRAIADWSIVNADGVRTKVLVPPGEVERIAARFCATGLVVEVDSAPGVIRRRDGSVVSDGQGEPTFTTIELLDVQSRIVSLVGAGIGNGCGTVDPIVVDAAIGSTERLSSGQTFLVSAWLTSGDRVQCAVGRAGTGKTTTMRVAAGAWTDAGYRVLGASVKGEAARQLANDAGIESETVAMLLARSDAGIPVLDARTVLIIDEASTIGDRDLLRLIELANDTGATLRLIGDTAQHGSVPTGGSFTELVEIHTTRSPELTTVRRLTDSGERHRAELVRSGQITQAIDELEASGQLVLTDSEHDTHAAMLTRWYNERAAGRPHPMVHGRNRERSLLNRLAQQILASDGVVDATRSVNLADGRRLCVGDETVARHGDRSIHPAGDRTGWMRNGTTGRIIDVRPSADPKREDEIDIDTDAGTITCGRSTFDRTDGGIDLAYAVTSYAVQGATNDMSTSAIGPSTNRSELYVDITRGRHNNQLYGTRPVTGDTDTQAHLPRLQTELLPVLRGRLARSDTRTALALNPRAPQVASAASGRTLAGLHAARRRGSAGADLDTVIRRAEAAVRRLAEHEPPANIELVLPACPVCPHLAARWRETVADVAVYLAVETPRIRPDQGALRGVIGSRAGAVDPARWDDTARSLRTTATDIALRQLTDHLDGHDQAETALVVRHRPEWLVTHLESRAETGGLANFDPARLATLVSDVHRWRVDHDLIDRTDPDDPLGPVPNDPHDRAEQVQLHRRLAVRARREPGRGIA